MRTEPSQIKGSNQLLRRVVGYGLQLWKVSLSWEKRIWPWMQLSTKSPSWPMRGYNIKTRGPKNEEMLLTLPFSASSPLPFLLIQKQHKVLWGETEKWNLFIKRLCIYFWHVWTSVTFEVLSIWCNTPIETFSHCSNRFWAHRFWCLLVLLLFFVSPFSHWQNVSFEDFFHLGKQQKKTRWIGRVGHGGHAVFWSKTAEHSALCGQVHS